MRERLAAQGVDGLVPEPGSTGYDSAYRRNLIDELVRSGTLGAPDLRLLGLDEMSTRLPGALRPRSTAYAQRPCP